VTVALEQLQDRINNMIAFIRANRELHAILQHSTYFAIDAVIISSEFIPCCCKKSSKQTGAHNWRPCGW
jgi:hypothetical protein